MTERSDGSTAHYYELPEWARELADLIRYKNMNGAQSEMFRALYRGDGAEHSDEQRQAKKLLAYATDEVVRTHFPEQSFKHYRDAVFAVIFEKEPECKSWDGVNVCRWTKDGNGTYRTVSYDWKPWDGTDDSGPRLLYPKDPVEVRFRNGVESSGVKANYRWGRSSTEIESDIVAYRVPVAPTQSSDWIPWTSRLYKPDPIKADQHVEVRLRSGRTTEGMASGFDWLLNGDGGDIVAYRILDEAPVQPTDQKADGGWIPWSGGTSSPSNLGPDQHVQIKRRNGETATGIKYSFDWRWHAGPKNLEIVAYRVVTEETSSE